MKKREHCLSLEVRCPVCGEMKTVETDNPMIDHIRQMPWTCDGCGTMFQVNETISEADLRAALHYWLQSPEAETTIYTIVK